MGDDHDSEENLLPYDGEVFYHGGVFSGDEAEELFQRLSTTIAWQQEELVMFGKRRKLNRKVAWYGDDGLSYTYSGQEKEAISWNEVLAGLKSRVEELSGSSYNACLCNFYHDGGDAMGWHSDDEKSIVPQSTIASLSFGAERPFKFRHRQGSETVKIMLENGSLLLMQGATQNNWKHALPKALRVKSPRINLTFRKMVT